MVLERDIQRTILDWLRVHRIFHWRNNSGAMASNYKGKPRFFKFGLVGSPDIFAVHRGICYGIEVKGAEGLQSRQQMVFQKDFEDAGGIYILAHSIEDVHRRIV